MKEVKDTKQPTLKQMISMSENLREKFKFYVSMSIDIDINAYDSRDTVDTSYKIYIESNPILFSNCESWEGLLSTYHKLMRGKKDE